MAYGHFTYDLTFCSKLSLAYILFCGPVVVSNHDIVFCIGLCRINTDVIYLGRFVSLSGNEFKGDYTDSPPLYILYPLVQPDIRHPHVLLSHLNATGKIEQHFPSFDGCI